MEVKTRYSQKREEIYRYLLSTKAHPSAEDIYNNLKNQVEGLSLATVYRNLRFLEDAGKIKKVYTNSIIERYDARCDEHAHFICSCCNEIIDLDNFYIGCINDINQYKVSRVNVSLEGLCLNCQRKKGE